MRYVPKDPVHQRILQGTVAATIAATLRAREKGTFLVYWKDDKVVLVDPNDVKLPENPS